MTDRKDWKGKPELVERVHDPVDAIFKVDAFGELKHGMPNTWMNNPDGVHVYLNALARHLKAHCDGELTDPESGMLHSWHALWNVNAIAYHINMMAGNRVTGLVVQ